MPASESIGYAQSDSHAFANFARGLDLSEPIDSDALNEVIYHNFYHNNGTALTPDADQMRAFSGASIEAARTIRDFTSDETRVKYQIGSLGWQSYLINEGFDNSQPVGRIYVNTKPDAMNPAFSEITERIATTDARVDIKAALAVYDDDNVHLTHLGTPGFDSLKPTEIDSNDVTEIFNRSDKIVVYTNPGHLDVVTDAISSFSAANPNALEITTPRFTRPVASSKGNNQLQGVGFAEETYGATREQRRAHRPLRAVSYGDFVRKVLTNILVENGPGGDMPSMIAARFETYGRDPYDPALNAISSFSIKK